MTKLVRKSEALTAPSGKCVDHDERSARGALSSNADDQAVTTSGDVVVLNLRELNR